MHTCAGGEHDLNEFDCRSGLRGGEYASHVSGFGIAPDRLGGAARERVRRSLDVGHQAGERDPQPVAELRKQNRRRAALGTLDA